MTTEIYILGKTKNPARQKQAWARYCIVGVRNNGQVEKKDGVVCLGNATTKKVVLTALSQALQRFNRPAVLKIYISDDFVRASLANGWANRWKANNWHKIRYNGQLAHEELWRNVVTQLSNHAVSFAKAEELDNKYIKELEWRMNDAGN